MKFLQKSGCPTTVNVDNMSASNLLNKMAFACQFSFRYRKILIIPARPIIKLLSPFFMRASKEHIKNPKLIFSSCKEILQIATKVTHLTLCATTEDICYQESFLCHTDPLLGKVLPLLYHLHHTRLIIPLVGSENLACGVIRIESQGFV